MFSPDFCKVLLGYPLAILNKTCSNLQWKTSKIPMFSRDWFLQGFSRLPLAILLEKYHDLQWKNTENSNVFYFCIRPILSLYSTKSSGPGQNIRRRDSKFLGPAILLLYSTKSSGPGQNIRRRDSKFLGPAILLTKSSGPGQNIRRRDGSAILLPKHPLLKKFNISIEF